MKALTVNLKLLLVLTFLSLLLLFFDFLNLLVWPKALVQEVTVPIEYGLYSSGQAVGRQLEFFRLLRVAGQENKALRTQLAQLLVENNDLRRKLQETQVLGVQYQKLSPDTYTMIPAKVIGTGRYMTINKGSIDGIKTNEAVVFEDSFIGRIKQVSPKSSRVLLLNDPDSKVTVFSQNGGGRAKGILLGQYSSDILMDKILHQEAVEVGDLVYTEGSEDTLTRGLIVGRISRVLERTNDVFKQAQVKPLWEVTDLDTVFVIANL